MTLTKGNSLPSKGIMPEGLTEDQQETFEQCLGHCSWCLWEGGCDLENILKAQGET